MKKNWERSTKIFGDRLMFGDELVCQYGGRLVLAKDR
jgi:hypothetical protein